MMGPSPNPNPSPNPSPSPNPDPKPSPDPDQVDVMMGTFTKSFGSVGGYVAASKTVVDTLRRHSAGFLYAPAMSPPAAAQALSAFEVIMGTHATAGDLGQRKILQLRANSNRLREGLVKMGCRVLGNPNPNPNPNPNGPLPQL